MAQGAVGTPALALAVSGTQPRPSASATSDHVQSTRSSTRFLPPGILWGSPQPQQMLVCFPTTGLKAHEGRGGVSRVCVPRLHTQYPILLAVREFLSELKAAQAHSTQFHFETVLSGRHSSGGPLKTQVTGAAVQARKGTVRARTCFELAAL